MNNLKHKQNMRKRLLKLLEAGEEGKITPDYAIALAISAEMTIFNWGSEREIREQRKQKAEALRVIHNLTK